MRLQALFESGLIAPIILMVMAIETIVLWRSIRAVPSLGAALAAGAALVLALWAALAGQDWKVIAVCLMVSLAFHLVEIRECIRLAKRLQR